MTPSTSVPAVTGDYTKQIQFSAPPDQVFDALTTVAGLASWWAPVTGSGAAGGELRFSYGAGQTMVVQVEEADRPSTVVWRVEWCNVLPDWAGTSPTFTVRRSAEGGSELAFRHEGLGPQLECYDQCRAGWDHFLPSLRAYVESGAGTPIPG